MHRADDLHHLLFAERHVGYDGGRRGADVVAVEERLRVGFEFAAIDRSPSMARRSR
jgi:hypothetical protein